MRRRYQAAALQPGVQPTAGPVRLPAARFNRGLGPGVARYTAVPVAAAPNQRPDLVAQLEQLGKLHGAGVLTDEEFSLAKQKLLRD